MRDLWPQGTRRSRFEQAAEEVRFQLGQSDRFREGIVRSGAWRDHIAATFERHGLPRELAALPHVESSFNTYAYSKVGAAGMWQFMRGTGRRFLRIDAVGRRAARSLSRDRGRGALPRTELHRARQLAARADRVQPRPGRHAARAGAARHERHRTSSCASTTAARSASPRATSTSRSWRRWRSTAIRRSSSARSAATPRDTSRVLDVPNFVPASRIAAALDLDRDELQPPQSFAVAVGVERLAPRPARFRAARARSTSI